MTDSKVLSLVIRARNASSDLQRCLNEVMRQLLPKHYELEIVVVDNESTDDTALVAKKFQSRIVEISAEEFTWGKALNLGIKQSRGDIIFLLSADAYPANENWIMQMIAPFENDKVAAVYGKQIPRPDAPIDEIVRLKKTFGNTSIMAETLPKDFTEKRGGGGIPASNACAAIRREVWKQLQYDEKISGAEDVLWTYNVLKMGRSVAYQADAQVYHSHRDPLFRNAWRSLELIKKNKELSGINATIIDYARYLFSLSKRRVKNLLYPGLGLITRIKGLLVLPLELISFCIVAPFFHDQKNMSKYRSFFWGQ